MASKNSTNCMVKVTIELGHQANFLKELSPEGFTHDWTVFVRGYEGSKIENFVEKVVFKLHKTFKMPTRVISEPPYKVTECGYAGFHLPIEIHFKNKQTPRKILFSYDLFLNASDRPPINNIRYEKLTFQNPTPEFKAKLLKAGGTEQGSDKVQTVFPDLLGSPPKGVSEKKSKSNNLNKEKHKKVKKVKKSPVRQASSESLPSLSPTSSEDELEKSPPVKERITPSLPKKESSSKKESSPTDKVKAKHESSSHKTKHPGSSEKDKVSKVHKEKEKNSSSHHKDGSKKEKDSKSHKSKDSHEKHKEREGSHSSSKSSSSSHGEKTSSHGEKSLSHGEKKSSAHSSSKEKPPSKEKEKEKESEESNKKHKSSHKSKEKEEKSGSKHKIKESGVSLDGPIEPAKKSKESSSKSKNVSEKEKSSKPALKRPSLSPTLDGESEKKKSKRSSSVGSEERNLMKTGSAEKEKTNSNIVTKEKKEIKTKELSKSSSSDNKSKHSRSKILEKSKSISHLNEDKPKSNRDNHSVERSDNNLSKHKDKAPKLMKSDSLTKAEQLAMTADFQPQLLLSPVRSMSEDENNANSPPPSLKKRRKSNSINSLSSLSSSDESNKSENEEEKPQNIVSDLVDSDSDSDEVPPPSKSPPKEIKAAYSKHSSQINSKNKKMLMCPSHEKIEKSRASDIKRREPISKSDVKINDGKKKSSDKEGTLSNSHEHVGKNGLDVLAPNGIPIGELMSINDKIERAQDNENVELINRVIDIIADTGEFDLDDSALSFDICSLEKSLVAQIQNLLRD